jgi:inner membrane protein involved in colicin E2 resistance
LMGAIALFILLSVVMYVTRKIDWYARDSAA